MGKANDIVIAGAVRTAIGTFNGTLKDTRAAELGAVVMKELLARAKVKPAEIDEVLMGQVLTAAAGQNPARQASMAAGLPETVPAMTLNRVCGSGLQAVLTAAHQIKAGAAHLMIAGGQENMSQAPHAVRLRDGIKMGDGKLLDTMVVDGLWDCFGDTHMGITAENVASTFNISRADQDAFALSSQEKAKAAIEKGVFADEIVPVSIPQKKGDPIEFKVDEHPRLSTLDVLAKLRPAFKGDGSVTAGNASGINDGAAALLVTTRAEADQRGLPVLATIMAGAVAGVAPEIMGTGPIPASQKALEMAGWSANDLDLVEANEAFAAQALAVQRALKLPGGIVNVHGGAIALGHPIGASGARVLVTLLHAMAQRDAKKGLATLCIGGGQGIALLVQR